MLKTPAGVEASAASPRVDVAVPRRTPSLFSAILPFPSQSTRAPCGNELEAELQGLRSENAKLREVETQFWPLLRENESLREEISRLRSHTDFEPHVPSISHSDLERCSKALRECMDLLLDRELGGSAARNHQLTRNDSVASYLLWLRTQQSASLDASREVKPEKALEPEKSMPSDAHEVRELREMLELTNTSRSQALEDCARMSRQLGELTQHLQRVLSAYSDARKELAERDALRDVVEKQKRDLANRDALLVEMRETLERLTTARSREETSLAAEAVRAREQLLSRRREHVE